ncbi:MAG TPA: hypothetical protein VME40_10550, partial [Caulobacteraceae bacterium]|nr:hypothetical protein [Caulobacteraceae bacterium]
LAFLGYETELWTNGQPPSLASSSPDTAPTDGRFIWADFLNDQAGEEVHWAVAWDSQEGGWVTRFGRRVDPTWRLKAWAPEPD